MSSRTDVDSAANGREGLVGVATQGGNGADADHDNEGQHHGVLNGRRAIFRLQEIHHELTELLHDIFLSEAWQSAREHKLPPRTHGFASPPYDGFAVSRNNNYHYCHGETPSLMLPWSPTRRIL